VRLSYRNELLKLDRAAKLRNSPYRNLPRNSPPALVAYAEFDTDEFRRQARDFATLWQRCYGNAELLALKGLNHYKAAKSLADPESPLARRAFAWFGL
jgi:arylformamidase